MTPFLRQGVEETEFSFPLPILMKHYFFCRVANNAYLNYIPLGKDNVGKDSKGETQSNYSLTQKLPGDTSNINVPYISQTPLTFSGLTCKLEIPQADCKRNFYSVEKMFPKYFWGTEHVLYYNSLKYMHNPLPCFVVLYNMHHLIY